MNRLHTGTDTYRRSEETHMANTSWLIVSFGDSGLWKQSCHERGEGGQLEILINQWRNEHSLRDELSYHMVFTKTDDEPILFTPVRT